MMTKDPEKLESVYWLKFPEWYTEEIIDGNYVYTIKPDAPERIKKSFEEWIKHNDTAWQQLYPRQRMISGNLSRNTDNTYSS